ncbi:MAG: hypothetical protein Q8S11_12680 [Daejeonella sp.]|uniref:hypothetical protein n=1 Tax=Daejeonella sp. TaxID=2805397 RepID=UPI0027371D00|nr:hypothetical protein [Daejeonella sp.]MDP3469186.1 hypothetical protein [Daejeonella sp.]
MIKTFRNIFFLFLFAMSFSATAQVTSSSPYSQFGLGDLSGSLLPQNRGMGGLSMGIRKPGLYDNINLANPASYSTLELTTFDVGASMDLRKLSKGGVSGKRQFNSTLSHITFGVPVNRFSAVSFGLVPYSDLGYQFMNSGTVDTSKVNYVYGGEGGMSKAYLGYGFRINKNLSLGFNVAYLFGSLKQTRAFEFVNESTVAFNSRTQYSNSVGGMSYDYALQYSAEISSKTKLILGYSGNSGNGLNSKSNTVTTRYRKDVLGDELAAADSTYFAEGAKTKIQMPLTHTAGFAFEKTNEWLFGADVTFSRWSDYREGSTNPGLNDSYGIIVGGQFTPDANSVSSYFKLIDYRLGVKYDKTFVKIGNNDINQYALNFGFGFPLPRNRSSFYKINLSTEIGQRGTEMNNLVRDRFVNIHLGFTLNDKWFQKTYID